MGLTEFAITKKRITGVALMVILLAGISTYNNMPRAEDPGFIIRTAQVVTYFPGASPERVASAFVPVYLKTKNNSNQPAGEPPSESA